MFRYEAENIRWISSSDEVQSDTFYGQALRHGDPTKQSCYCSCKHWLCSNLAMHFDQQFNHPSIQAYYPAQALFLHDTDSRCLI
jgi:hypothetical protein